MEKETLLQELEALKALITKLQDAISAPVEKEPEAVAVPEVPAV